MFDGRPQPAKHYQRNDRECECIYGVDTSTHKTKVMVNNSGNGKEEFYMNGVQMEEINSFNYFGVALSKDGS